MRSLIPKMSPNPNFIPPVCLRLFICLVGSLARGELSHQSTTRGGGIKENGKYAGKRQEEKVKYAGYMKRKKRTEEYWRRTEELETKKTGSPGRTGKQKTKKVMMKETGNRKLNRRK